MSQNAAIQGRRVLLVAPSPPPYGGMAIQAGLLQKFIREDGHEVIFVSASPIFPRGLRWAASIWGLRTAIRALLIWVRLLAGAARAEVVHILGASWLYFATIVCPAVLVGRLFGRRVILNYRGGDAREFFRSFGVLIKPIFRLANVLTAPSAFLSDAIRNSFGYSAKIVPNILDASLFGHRQRAVVRPRLLITRHLEKIYDVESALRCFRVVQERYPEASLLIAGTGSEEQRLRGLAAEWNLRSVQFLGYVAHKDLGAVYDRCDILLNASRVDNFPGSLLEAAGAGLVIVSTGAGGIPFMFSDGRNALLVEPGDWKGLANAVERVLEDPSLALQLADHAAALARRWEWPAVRRTIYETYGFEVAKIADEACCAEENRAARPV